MIDTLVTATPTVGSQLVDYGLAFLTAVATPVTAWVGWKVSTWLESKKIVNHDTANAIIGNNLDLAARKAIEFAKQELGNSGITARIDTEIDKSAVVKIAAKYLAPKMKETIDRLGFSPSDLEDFIRARLHLPVEVPQTVTVTTSASTPKAQVALAPGNPVLRS